MVLLWKDFNNSRLITSALNGFILKAPPSIPVPSLFLFLLHNKTVCDDRILNQNFKHVSPLRENNLPNGRIQAIGTMILKERKDYSYEMNSFVDDSDNGENVTGYGSIDDPFLHAVDYPVELKLDGSFDAVATAQENKNRFNYVVHMCYAVERVEGLINCD